MKRSVGVTAAAVVSLLGSLTNLLFGLLILLGAVMASRSATPPPAAGLVLSTLFFLLSAALGIATSVGLLRLKRWARTSILVFAGLLTFSGLCTPIVLLTINLPSTAAQDPHVWGLVKTGMTVFYLLLAAIGVWWLALFNLAAVKAQFYGAAPTASASARPISITCIAWLLILGAVCLPFALWLHLPAVVFGHLVAGWSGTLWYLAFAVVGLYTGLGLLRLDRRCRQLAIYFLLFGTLNSAPFYLLPGSTERMAELIQRLPTGFRPAADQPIPTLNPWVMLVFMAAFVAVQLYFLVTRSAAFERPLHPDAA